VKPEWVVVGLSIISIISAGINVFIGLRLAALQSKMQAASIQLELSLMKQFGQWKDEILQTLNGKYVTATLVAEMRQSISHDLSRIDRNLDRIEERCASRISCLLPHPKSE
jgi:hypothetical protein